MTRSAGTVVLGYGVTGRSVVQHLCKQDIYPLVLDTRSQPATFESSSDIEVLWQVEEWPRKLLAKTNQVIVSPGLPLHHPLVRQAQAAGIPLFSDIDLFMSQVDAPVIGVTGTNGKSTVVSLVGHLLQVSGLRCSVGGNLG
ncbi:MAG: UDP-N-acetylmuramoyl-L-alanine--D-glutamate ligase, partial [Pseudomonadota bacterium]|nr:UDP-N-acetylmuramoyl-L-alanine--D-glutamate ligase [Pseudomonadota bacterium]